MEEYTYSQAIQQFQSLFNIVPTGWNYCYSTGEKPLMAYTAFETLQAANAFVGGLYDTEEDEYTYFTYAGALISVVKDSSNNGTYRVVYTNAELPNHGNRYGLVKLLSTDDNVGGQITVVEKTDSGTSGTPSGKTPTPYIYFVGVDTSTAVQHPDTLYFNHGIVYDASGNMILQESDARLKDVIGKLDPDFEALKTIDKVVFNWKQDKSHKDNIGVIAQSVEKVYPELIGNNPDTGYKMVNYTGLGVIALAAIDKLYDRVRELEAKVAELESK